MTDNEKFPYNQRTLNITLLRDVQDIIEFDKAVRGVTEGWEKPIRIGSLFRASELVMDHFGIKITKANKEQIREEANRRYIMDTEEQRAFKTERDVLHLLKTGHRAQHLENMSFAVSSFAKEFMASMDDGKREFHVCDIAAGVGRCSSAVFIALSEVPGSILERTVFHVVDYSERAAIARRNLENLGARVVVHQKCDEDFLKTTGERFDIVTTISHLHKKPFLRDHLKEVNSVMNNGGVFISGTWHSSICHYPNRLYLLLQDLGVRAERLEAFNSIFGPLSRKDMDSKGPRYEEEVFANIDHVSFLRRVSLTMEHSRYRGRNRIRVIGAFTTNRQLVQELEGAGFETSGDAIRKAFPNAKLQELPFRPSMRRDTVVVTPALKRIK
ncbi:class I SAM-dependent methyltransferase [Candidatus Micrarchaeota archaeon]|nr:class I SAM-dependent methyltransferase [Candidatus Micrarchaeota archaeon]